MVEYFYRVIKNVCVDAIDVKVGFNPKFTAILKEKGESPSTNPKVKGKVLFRFAMVFDFCPNSIHKWILNIQFLTAVQACASVTAYLLHYICNKVLLKFLFCCKFKRIWQTFACVVRWAFAVSWNSRASFLAICLLDSLKLYQYWNSKDYNLLKDTKC